ncbi:MAG: DUF4397 domain-containing protein [Ktedonobacteraceae bacterium]
MDGTKLLSSFQYATVSNYLPLPSGAHDIKVALIGKGADAAVVTQTLQVITGKVYTIAAVGMQSNKSLALEVFEDNNAVSGNTAKVRIYHLSPGTGTVDVSEDTRKVIQNVSYEQASDYLSVPAGTYTFNATITPANATIPISTELKPWTVTSFFAIGLLNNDPQLKFVSSQTTGTPGMPQTGSAPVASVNVSQSLLIWSVALLVLLLTIVSCGVYYRVSGIFNTKK